MTDTVQDHISEEEVRIQKLRHLQETQPHAFSYSYDKTHSADQINATYGHLQAGESSEDKVQFAGRLVAKRGHGKALFGNLQDQSGAVQFYVNTKLVDEQTFELISSADVGDIVGVKGTPFSTKRGELSIRVTAFELLTKALLPLPEKYHGLQDKELRYRMRYLDLIANPDTIKTFETRSKTVHLIRDYLHRDGFMEVETPVLQHIYGGASARPFSTHHNELGQDLYLRISLELPLKRLIVGGFEKIFEIGRVFRNEGVSYKHNPEYTLLELYQAFVDYEEILKLTETLLSNLVKDLTGGYTLTYQGTELNFQPPFQRYTFKDALKKFADVDMDDETALRQKAKDLGLELSSKANIGQVVNEIYDKTIEPNLIQPTFMMDHPWETSPLAKKHRANDKLVERFELIANGMELANAFSELNDAEDQHSRFEDQAKAKEAGDEEAQPMDDDYIKALKQGMPPTSGLGIGIDRIVMLLTDSHSIRDVLFFPHMRT